MLTPGEVVAMWDGRGWDDMWGMHGGGGWWVVLVMVGLVLIVVAAVAALAVSLGRSGSAAPGGPATGTGSSAAGHLLDERYARGEIDEQEYLHRRAVLGGR